MNAKHIVRPSTRLPFVNSPLVHLPRRRKLCAVNYSGTGRDANLFLVDTETLAASKHPLPEGENGAYGFVRGSDGKLYLGTFSGSLYRFDPETEELSLLCHPFQSNGETTGVVWSGGASRSGKIYMGAYPTGEFCEYDIASGQYRILRPMPPRNGLSFYARAFTELPDGSVLVFVGGARPELFAYRPETEDLERTKTDEPLPTALSFECFLDDGRLIANREKQLVLFDWRRRRFAEPLAPGQPENISGLAWRKGVLHGVGFPSGTLYRLAGGRAEPLDRPLPLDGGRLVQLICEGGEDFVSLTDNGLAVRFNPEDSAPPRTSQVPNETTAGMHLSMLEPQPGGPLMVGAHFINMQIFVANRATGEVRPSRHKVSGYSGQVTCGVWVGEVFYFASYGSAVLYRFQPDKPFAYGENPRVIGPVGHEQNRPMSLVSDGRRLYMASKAGYGRLGGAISVYALDSGEIEVHRDFVPGQNPQRMFLDAPTGRLAGATTIAGDQGSAPPAAEHGRVFVWDTDTRQTLATMEPWKAPGLPATALSPNGTLVGFDRDRFYLCDVRGLTCETRSWPHGPVQGGIFLDGRRFLGAGESELFLYDMESQGFQPLIASEGARLVRRAGEREILFDGKQTEVWELGIPGVESSY